MNIVTLKDAFDAKSGSVTECRYIRDMGLDIFDVFEGCKLREIGIQQDDRHCRFVIVMIVVDIEDKFKDFGVGSFMEAEQDGTFLDVEHR